MNVDAFSGLLIIFVILVCYRIYHNSDAFQLKCIISDVDGEKYCVRERNKLNQAADRLAHVNKNLKAIIAYCEKNYPDKDITIRMKDGYNPRTIVETLPTSEYTAYSENKGEKLAFCLDTEKGEQGKMIDLNTLTYVAIHELAHIGTESIGHTPEFWKNFKFLLTVGKDINVYKPVDYKKNPKQYCGMKITDNPYYDA